MTSSPVAFRTALNCTLLSMALAACGGGGGGSGGATPVPAPPPVLLPAPIIYQDSATASVVEGDPLTLSVYRTVRSEGSTTYQWQRNGVNIAGATGSSYTLPAAQMVDHGSVFQITARTTGGATTASTTVTVLPSLGNITLLAGALSGQLVRASLTNPLHNIVPDSTGGFYLPHYWEDKKGLAHLPATGPLTGLAAQRDATCTARYNRATSDYAGNVYWIVDCHLWKITPDGERLHVSALEHAAGPGSDSAPSAMTVDNNGNVYLINSSAAIRKISALGVATTLAGHHVERGNTDGEGGAARFNYPNCIAADGAGNVYVCDTDRIRKVTPAGSVSTYSNIAVNNLVVDRSGGIVAARNGELVVLSSTGSVTRLLAGSQRGAARDGTGADAVFSGIASLVAGANGDLLVGDYGVGIRKVTPAGVVTTVHKILPELDPRDTVAVDGVGTEARLTVGEMALDAHGLLYVIEGQSGALRTIDGSGRVKTLPVKFPDIRQFLVDAEGNIITAEYQTVSKRTPAGASSVLFTSEGKLDASGRPIIIYGLALDASNTVHLIAGPACTFYIRQPLICYSGEIIRLDANGQPTVLAGQIGEAGLVNGVGSAAKFAGPSNLAFDSGGNLFVTDFNNRLIRKVTPQLGVETWSGVMPDVTDVGYIHTNEPYRIWIDRHDDVYYGNRFSLNKRTQSGLEQRVLKVGSLPQVTGAIRYPGLTRRDFGYDAMVSHEGVIYLMVGGAIYKITQR